MQEQTLALLVFLVIPFNHSIHHYRDMPVVLASSAIFLLGADVLRKCAGWRAPWLGTRRGADPPGSAPRDTVAAQLQGTTIGDALERSTASGVAARPVSAASLPANVGADQYNAVERVESASDGSVPAAAAAPSAPPDRWLASPPARRHLVAKRNHEPSQEASRGDEKASRGRHLDVTNWGRARIWLGIPALMLLGIWSRIEVVAFVGVLVVALLIVYRRQAIGLCVTYAAAAIFVTSALLFVYRLENVDLGQAWFYTAHTFLDSTPDSWLTPECRADPTENCREADGLSYFGPANLRAGVLALAMNHPLITLAKSVRSAWDNAWVLVGPNLSTFPFVVPFLVLIAALMPQVRGAYRQVPLAAWVLVVAIIAESVLPPLTWAPPHPQYHVALVLPMVVLLVPALVALMRLSRARWLALGFLALQAGLSAFRYTRYPGY
jgi:hypothetical protein